MSKNQPSGEAQTAFGSPIHQPVMPEEVCTFLLEGNPQLVVDCTLGLGGHSRLILEKNTAVRLLGLDLDEDNLRIAGQRLAGYGDRVVLRQANFADLSAVLREVGWGPVGAILADLGVSSNQIEDAARGLSFDRDGPLDMRLDRTQTLTAADLVNGLSEGELADLLYMQSQEHGSRKISKRICQARRQGRLDSTVALARLVASALGQDPDARRSRIHPATRTFMALRMSVNRELQSLRRLLEQAPDCLSAGGRLAIISFHSGEDRIVKEDFRARAQAGVYRLLTKKPAVASDVECAANPRSRSAKLRVAERVGAVA